MCFPVLYSSVIVRSEIQGYLFQACEFVMLNGFTIFTCTFGLQGQAYLGVFLIPCSEGKELYFVLVQ
jgi:hypothetical protein